MSVTRLVTVLLCAIGMSAPGCDFLSGGGYEVEIRTDADSYLPSPQAAITLTVTNRSEDPLYFVCYGRVDLQELDGSLVTGSWYISGAEQCGVVTLEKGDKAERVYLFDDGSNLESVADAKYDSDVRYRFRFRLFKDRRGSGDPIDEYLQYSNEFIMVKAAIDD